MIGRLTGTVVHCRPDELLLDVAGVGYEVRIPLSTFYVLSGGGSKSASVHVHTHVREDAFQLYGFATRDERATFCQLISISGVGPRLALATLSGIGVDELRAAVVQRDLKRLQSIPGIGTKTAERVLLEVRYMLEVGASDRPAAGDDDPALRPGVDTDAVSALTNLGYSQQIASRAVGQVVESQPDAGLEIILKEALASLVR